MKKLFLFGLATIMLFACQNQPQLYFSESAEIESLKTGIKDYEAQNWEAWLAQFADTAKVYHNSNKGITAKESANMHKGMLSNFSSYGFSEKGSFVEMVIDKDDETWVNYWATWSGKLKENGKELEVPVHITAQYINGKIAEEYAYYDTAPMNAALSEIEKANNLPVEDKAIIAQVDKFINEFLNKKNTSILDDLIADDYIRYMNDVKAATNSKELVEGIQVFFTGFPDFNITTLHRSPIFNNTMFIHWQMTGTNTGEFNDSPATGKKVKVYGLSRVHFNGDGKMDEENIFYDQLNLMQQLGKILN